MTGKLADLVSELETRIDSARLVSGQRLVEGDLTREFGVSRALLREAFRHLAADGAIELIPNRGAEVRRLSKTEAMELFEIRTELEAMAARRAAGRMGDPAVRDAFQAATDEILGGPALPGVLEYVSENERFHRAVFVASGNQSLQDLARRMRLPLIMSQIRDILTPDVLTTSRDEHLAIARAILGGEAARAEALMRDHLTRATRIISAAPGTLFRA